MYYLYCSYDADKQLLYAGIVSTDQAIIRLRRDGEGVALMTVKSYESRADAETAREEITKDEPPKWTHGKKKSRHQQEELERVQQEQDEMVRDAKVQTVIKNEFESAQ